MEKAPDAVRESRNLLGTYVGARQRKRSKFGPILQTGKSAFSSRANKHEVAKAIIQHFPELAPRLPFYRKPWMSEDYRMSIFDAVALGLTFFQLV